MARQEQGDAVHITRVLPFVSVLHLGGVDDAFCKHTFFSYVEKCPLKNPFLLLVNWKMRPDRIVCCLNGGSEVDSISEQIITLTSNTGLWFNLMLFILIITVYLN